MKETATIDHIQFFSTYSVMSDIYWQFPMVTFSYSAHSFKGDKKITCGDLITWNEWNLFISIWNIFSKTNITFLYLLLITVSLGNISFRSFLSTNFFTIFWYALNTFQPFNSLHASTGIKKRTSFDNSNTKVSHNYKKCRNRSKLRLR